MDEQNKPDAELQKLIDQYKKMGLDEKRATMLATADVNEKLEASKAKRMKEGEPLMKAFDDAKVAFDNAVTNSKEKKAFDKAKAALDALKSSEAVAPVKKAVDDAKAKLDAFFEKNPDLKKGRGGSRSGAGRKPGYKGDVKITNIESGEVLTFPTMNTAYRHVLSLRGEELSHGIGWNQAKPAFGKEGWEIEQLAAPVATEA